MVVWWWYLDCILGYHRGGGSAEGTDDHMGSSLSISDSHQLVVKHEPCTVWCLDLQLTAFIFHAFFFVYPLQVWDPISTNTPRYGSNWGTNPTGLLCTVNPPLTTQIFMMSYTPIYTYISFSWWNNVTTHGKTLAFSRLNVILCLKHLHVWR